MTTSLQDNLNKLRNLDSHLRGNILGQDHALPRIVDVLQRGELGLATPNRPRGSFLFLGPTGVGKTETTVEFTRYLFGEEKLFRFDMSEYQTQDSLRVLIGGSVGEVGTVGLATRNALEGTLLFDECEKAHPRVLDILLQILDAARVTMANGQTLDFSGFYVVLTSNLGSVEILNLQHSSFTTMERHVLAKAQQTLRPELYARITEKIVFDRLGFFTQVKIATLRLEREFEFLKMKGVNLVAADSVLPFLIRQGFSSRLGSRPLRDAIERFVRGAVAKAMLEGKPSGGLLTVTRDNSALHVQS